MSALSRNVHVLRRHSQTFFTWQLAAKNTYRLLCGSDVRGAFTLSLEPSILFSPTRCEFYRAAAEVGEHRYFFKCVFLDGAFRGSLMTDQAAGQPLAFFQERSSKWALRRRSRILLCEEGTSLSWVRGGDAGHWILRGRFNRLLELKSSTPERHGIVRVHDPAFLKNPHSRALILFCIYLVIGPKRASSPVPA